MAARTSPSRRAQDSVNGERRSFALLRPILDASAQERVRDLLLEAYAAHEEQVADERARRSPFTVPDATARWRPAVVLSGRSRV